MEISDDCSQPTRINKSADLYLQRQHEARNNEQKIYRRGFEHEDTSNTKIKIPTLETKKTSPILLTPQWKQISWREFFVTFSVPRNRGRTEQKTVHRSLKCPSEKISIRVSINSDSMSIFAQLQQTSKPVTTIVEENDDQVDDSSSRRLRLDVEATNRFIQHGLASCEGLSLRQWRAARTTNTKTSATSTKETTTATTTTKLLRRSSRSLTNNTNKQSLKSQPRLKRSTSTEQINGETPVLRRSLRLAMKQQLLLLQTTTKSVSTFGAIVNAPIVAFATKTKKTASEIRQASTQRRTAHLMKKRLAGSPKPSATTQTTLTTITTTATTTTRNIFALMAAPLMASKK
jgi:hypothetical protein